ncbi:MAG: PfkB family carbohydrate kinase [Limisphaerales bacterium]
MDELIYVAAYPPADAKTRVLRRERHCGGLTATALVAGARLGARCAYAGVLGADEQSQFVLDALAREGIDVSRTRRLEGVRPIRSVIVVGEHRKTRNIFFDAQGVVGADPKWPSATAIRSARVLLVDVYGVPGMIRAARIARAAGIPVVGDFERDDVPQFAALFALVDHLIIPAPFACKLTGARSAAAATEELWKASGLCRPQTHRTAARGPSRVPSPRLSPVGQERVAEGRVRADSRNPDLESHAGRAVVIVTCGEKGCYSADASAPRARLWPTFKVKAVDTTGCGDVFHGAYAAALAQGMGLAERIRVASAAAALKATRPGGQAGIPTRAAVDKFLKRT